MIHFNTWYTSLNTTNKTKHHIKALSSYTVELILKDHPTDHKNVVCQDRWSMVTGSLGMHCNAEPSAMNMWSFKTGSLSWQWSLKTGFTVYLILYHHRSFNQIPSLCQQWNRWTNCCGGKPGNQKTWSRSHGSHVYHPWPFCLTFHWLREPADAWSHHPRC